MRLGWLSVKAYIEADIRKARERKEKEDAAEDAEMEDDEEEEPVSAITREQFEEAMKCIVQNTFNFMYASCELSTTF